MSDEKCNDTCSVVGAAGLVHTFNCWTSTPKDQVHSQDALDESRSQMVVAWPQDIGRDMY